MKEGHATPGWKPAPRRASFPGMIDLLEDDGPPGNAPEFTVSEISGAVKRVIEGEFGLVRVRGEIGRVSRPASGHLYFDLKDDRAVLAAICWKGQAGRLEVRPEEGLEVVATGRLTTFPGQSKYQMIVEDIRPAGMGALMAMLEKRRRALEAEGLFAASRKKPLPYLPEVIGVVTSPSGAVIRDILHRLRDRFPRKVLIWPVAVQGTACAPEVAAAIRGFNALTPGGALPRPDLLIVARGGGSLEDLWGFNEEIVVRAAADSAIPLISAVGHETDTTLIDFAADRRAPTPTAAAEMAVPVRLELLATAEAQGARLNRALVRGMENRRQRLRDLARALPRPERLLDAPRQRLDLWGARLPGALTALTGRKRNRLTEAGAVLRPRTLQAALRQRREALLSCGNRLGPAFARALAEERRRIARDSEKLAERARRLELAFAQGEARRADRLASLARVLATLGYEETLKRGYAVVRGDGAVVTSAAEAGRARALEIQFQDGRLAVGPGARGGGAAPRPPKPEQGSLF
jgi:exodeoxyribonuclease VII large subunit